MPKKETPESIEAELNANQSERMAADLKDVVRSLRQFEADLEARERAKGIKIERGKPLARRLAAVGWPKAAIQETMELFGAFDLIIKDRPEEVSERVWRKLAEMEETRISALDQLQDILDARRGERPTKIRLPINLQSRASSSMCGSRCDRERSAGHLHHLAGAMLSICRSVRG
jgi:hypothetical protein